MRRLMRRSAWILAAAMTLAAVGWWLARPTAPDGFYELPADATPGPPGALHRQASFGRGVPPGAQGWRILYATTRADGAPWTATCGNPPAQKNLVTPMNATVPIPIQ